MSTAQLQFLLDSLRAAQPPRRPALDVGWQPCRVRGTLQERWERKPKYALSEQDLADIEARKTEAAREQEIHDRRQRLAAFLSRRGRQYGGCTLDNFVVECPAQGEVLRVVRAYAGRLREEIAAGRGLLFLGPCGVGKGHLTVALARIAIIDFGFSVAWVNAAEWFRRLRSAIGEGAGESSLFDPLVEAHVLLLDDPVPPHGALTVFEAARLFDLLEARNRHRRPVWTTMNVADREEAESRATVPVVERLLDLAIPVHCDWPSYRRRRMAEELTG